MLKTYFGACKYKDQSTHNFELVLIAVGVPSRLALVQEFTKTKILTHNFKLALIAVGVAIGATHRVKYSWTHLRAP